MKVREKGANMRMQKTLSRSCVVGCVFMWVQKAGQGWGWMSGCMQGKMDGGKKGSVMMRISK